MSSNSANFQQNVVRYRGDTRSIEFQRVDISGNAVDITGRTYRLVVDPSPSPSDGTNNVYELVGVITDADAGKYKFPFSQVQADSAVGAYHYDVEETLDEDGSSVSQTIGGGTWTIVQGIS